MGAGWLPVASHSRTWEPSELWEVSIPELEVRAIHETLSKLRHIAAYCESLEVFASDTARMLI